MVSFLFVAKATGWVIGLAGAITVTNGYSVEANQLLTNAKGDDLLLFRLHNLKCTPFENGFLVYFLQQRVS